MPPLARQTSSSSGQEADSAPQAGENQSRLARSARAVFRHVKHHVGLRHDNVAFSINEGLQRSASESSVPWPTSIRELLTSVPLARESQTDTVDQGKLERGSPGRL